MPVRRLERNEQISRMSDMELFLSQQRGRVHTAYIGYLYSTEKKGEWYGYVDLYGQRHDITAKQDFDNVIEQPTVVLSFTGRNWLEYEGDIDFTMFHRSRKTWGGTVHMPLFMVPVDGSQDIELSLHFNHPPAPQLRGRKPYAWRITQRVSRT